MKYNFKSCELVNNATVNIGLHVSFQITESYGSSIFSFFKKASMLRVWRKRNPLTLLVGMQTSTATMENSVEIP